MGAYAISVCLYINILASFLLGGIGEQYDTPRNEHFISVAVIVLIGAIGYFKGLQALAKLEKLALGGTLLIIQFSAAVADTLGGSGNTVEATHNHVDLKHATLLICGGAAILCFAPTLTILALASRAFAFYYMLQCLVASSLAKSPLQRCFFYLLAAVLAFITLFAVPAG